MPVEHWRQGGSIFFFSVGQTGVFNSSRPSKHLRHTSNPWQALLLTSFVMLYPGSPCFLIGISATLSALTTP
jgi:hypothetical protein